MDTVHWKSAGDASRFKVKFFLRVFVYARARADDGLLVSWIFPAVARGSPTGSFEALFVNISGHVLTGESLLLLLFC